MADAGIEVVAVDDAAGEFQLLMMRLWSWQGTVTPPTATPDSLRAESSTSGALEERSELVCHWAGHASGRHEISDRRSECATKR